MDSGLVPFLISCKDLPSKSVGYLGLVGNISNVLNKTSANQLNSFAEWKDFVEQFLDPKNFQEKVILGQGSLRVKSEILEPEVEDEFFDAIEGPEDYQIPGIQFNLTEEKIEQDDSPRDIDLKEDLSKEEENFKVESNENKVEVEGNLNEEEKKNECSQ